MFTRAAEDQDGYLKFGTFNAVHRWFDKVLTWRYTYINSRIYIAF